MLKISYILVVIFIALFAFSPLLKADFTNWDDRLHILENPLVINHSFQTFKEIFTTTINETYIPLSIVSFNLDHVFFGFNAFVFHLNNLLLHILVVILVYVIGQELGLSILGSSVAALIFAIHPMHVESVAWVTERKDVLYAVFYLLSILAYLNYLKNKNRMLYCGSLLLGVLSLLAKPMALSLPLVLLAIDFLKQRQEIGKFLDKTPFLLFFIPITWITYSLHIRGSQFEFGTSFLIWLWSLSFYILHFIFPYPCVPIYKLSYPVSIIELNYFISIVILTVLACLLWKWRMNRWFVFSFLFYFLSIFFLLRFDDVDNTIVADRFMYLPSLGFCFLIGWGIEQVFLWKNQILQRLIFSFFGCAIFFLSVATFNQNIVWQNSLNLWNYVISKTPSVDVAYLNRGEVYYEKKQYDLALKDFQQTLVYQPRQYRAYNNMGNLYSKMGNVKKAIENYDKALALKNDYADGYFNRALTYLQMSAVNEAISDFTQYITLNPQSPKGFYYRAMIYGKLGDKTRAQEDIEQLRKLGFKVTVKSANRSESESIDNN